MATQTTNYGLTKPAWDDMADVSVLNNNSDIIDAQMHANELSAKQSVANMAAAYDATATYSEGDYCTYGGKLYQANTDISVAEAFDATHWDETTAAEHFSDGGGGGGGGGVHYSTTEQVIGTWIDGKTLYQRTFTIQNIQFNNSGFYDMDLSTENTSLILAIYDASYYTWTYNSAELRRSFERIAVEDDHVLLVGPTSRNITIAYVTLRYTKTTD